MKWTSFLTRHSKAIAIVLLIPEVSCYIVLVGIVCKSSMKKAFVFVLFMIWYHFQDIDKLHQFFFFSLSILHFVTFFM